MNRYQDSWECSYNAVLKHVLVQVRALRGEIFLFQVPNDDIENDQSFYPFAVTYKTYIQGALHSAHQL